MIVYDVLQLIECIMDEQQGFLRDLLHSHKNVVTNDYSSLGFILGDGTVISKKRYWYVEVKSTLVYTIISALLHVGSIAQRRYIYYQCSHSGHSRMNYHIRIKTYDEKLEYIKMIKRKEVLLDHSFLTPEFIAGYFDADGSITINSKTGQSKIVFISNNPALLQVISAYLRREHGISMSKHPSIIRPHLFLSSNGIKIRKGLTYQIYTTNLESLENLIDLILPYVAHIIRRAKLVLVRQYISRNLSKKEFVKEFKFLSALSKKLNATEYNKHECLDLLDRVIKCVSKWWRGPH